MTTATPREGPRFLTARTQELLGSAWPQAVESGAEGRSPLRIEGPRPCPLGCGFPPRAAAPGTPCGCGVSRRGQPSATSCRLAAAPRAPSASHAVPAPFRTFERSGFAGGRTAGGSGGGEHSWGEAVSPPLAGRGPPVRDKQDGEGVERALVSSPLPSLPKDDHRQSRPRLPAAGKPLSPRPGRRARSRGVTESRGRPPASRKLPLNQSCPSPARSPLRPAASLCARLEPCPAPGSSGAHRGGRFGAAAAAFGAGRAPGVLCRDGPAGWEGRRRGGQAPGS